MDETVSDRHAPGRVTLVRRVAVVLDDARGHDEAGDELAARRRALMYAEAIDDADEADAVLRFGPRLEACLAALGVDLAGVGVDLRTRAGRRPLGSSLAA